MWFLKDIRIIHKCDTVIGKLGSEMAQLSSLIYIWKSITLILSLTSGNNTNTYLYLVENIGLMYTHIKAVVFLFIGYRQNNFCNTYDFLFVFSTGKFAAEIGPIDANMVKKEAEPVTLTCSYQTSYSPVWLYWYKQNPNSAPQFLGAKGSTSQRTADDPRFKSETTGTLTKLTITNLKLTDSALYHCALREAQ